MLVQISIPSWIKIKIKCWSRFPSQFESKSRSNVGPDFDSKLNQNWDQILVQIFIPSWIKIEIDGWSRFPPQVEQKLRSRMGLDFHPKLNLKLDPVLTSVVNVVTKVKLGIPMFFNDLQNQVIQCGQELWSITRSTLDQNQDPNFDQKRDPLWINIGITTLIKNETYFGSKSGPQL